MDGALPNKVVKESGGAPRRPFSLLRLVLALLAGLGISYLFYWMGDILGLSRADVPHRVGDGRGGDCLCAVGPAAEPVCEGLQ